MDKAIQCEQARNDSFYVNKLGSQLNLPGWYHELYYENDSNLHDYLMFGVSNGFLIVDKEADIPRYECSNYHSVEKGPAHNFIDNLLKSELADGKYVIADTKPHCIHALGAVPKKETGKWRPITDCKRPIGTSVNSYMSTTFREFTYTTVDNVIELIKPGYFMSSVDIASAYRSILIHPSNWKYQGICWNIDDVSRYLYDTHLCFGARCAPYLFTQVSNFILRCLKRRGFELCTVYLDDFLLIGRTKEECMQAKSTLISILRSLGFRIAWNKCVSPSQKITYLGVTFDSKEMTVSLPPSKMDRLHHEINFFMSMNRATKRQIQQLCGILAHCSKIVKGGRTFSHRIIDLLKGWPTTQKRIRLSDSFKYDLYWWHEFSRTFNGKKLMVSYNYGHGPSFFTDSCLAGYGMWSLSDWQAGYFNTSTTPDTSSLIPEHFHWMNIHVDDANSANNINVLELVPVWLSVKRNQHLWRDLHVLCFTDNQSVLQMINKGHSSNSNCMTMLRDIFWDCAKGNIHLTARYIPSKENTWQICCHAYSSRIILSLFLIFSYVVAETPPTDMVKLDEQLELIIRAAWAESTLKTRNSQWDRYIKFCKANGLSAVPADPTTVARFLVDLARTCVFSTCNNYLSAIIGLHKFFGHDYSFRDCFLIKLVIQGLGRHLGKAVLQKRGLTPQDLMAIYSKLDLSDVNIITMWSAIVLSFRTMLRKSNIVQTDTGMVILRSDIKFLPTGLLLRVRKTKTLQRREYVLEIPFNYSCNKTLCAASMLATHLARTSFTNQGAMFLLYKAGKWRPLLYAELLQFIKDCVKKICLPQGEVGLHSLRRSGAAYLHSLGFSLVDIINAGDWHSLAALSYLLSPLERKIQVESVVTESLDKLRH